MNETAKATPTPWRAEYDPPEVVMGGHMREWKVLGQLEGFGTAQYVASCFHFPQSQANAELIAAAVNSHEAALELARAVDEVEKRRFVKRRLHAYANLPPEVADWTQIVALARKVLGEKKEPLKGEADGREK